MFGFNADGFVPSVPASQPAPRRPRKRKFQPLRQGQLDGLCGIYAIVNACRKVGGLSMTETTDLFKALMRHVTVMKPEAILNGLRPGELKVLCGVAATQCPGLEFSYPFKTGGRISSIDGFARRVDDALGDGGCAILAIGDPWNHWTVTDRVLPKSFSLIDSSGSSSLRFSSISVMDEADKLDLWPRQTVLIRAR